MKVLIVDDHKYNRDLLGFILLDEGHEYIEAENGEEACQLFGGNDKEEENENEIDLVLMDINMPIMDGISATRKIKSILRDKFVPVIFVTALDDAEVISRCLEAGGDDFVAKPVNEGVLTAKINAHLRSLKAFKRLNDSREMLEYHKQLMDREHSIVECVFANEFERRKTECDNLKTYTSPMSLFNGDLVLSAPSPAGGIYLLVGDFTGHGLSAAIGSLPVSGIFHNLTEKQSSVSQIASDINERLYELLPTNMFFCATLVEIDDSGTSAIIWSGGMNDIVCIDNDTDEIRLLQANHMPLGILSPQEFDQRSQMYKFGDNCRIYFYTDGIVEATNIAGEDFGEERLIACLSKKRNDTLKYVVEEMKQFQGRLGQSDDISLVEILTGPVCHRSIETREVIDVAAAYRTASCFPWKFTISLNSEDLQEFDAVSQIMGFVGRIRGIELHEDKLFTIVSELYSNALEHGVLRLSSAIKESPDGFDQYYKLREERLEKLVDQYINIDIEYVQGDPNAIKLVLLDSGDGFDVTASRKNINDNNDMHGRGMHLLSNLCASLEYSENGRQVTAIYELK